MAESAREKLERVFFEAVEKEGAAREEFLREACDGETTLLGEVRGLLEADARETIRPLRAEPLKAFLDAAAAPVEEPVPERIGVYKIEGLIGEGGFGAVYRARQTEPVERVVAIKMVRAGMATRESLRRFERERRTLAQLEHPNIARLLDAGTTEEQGGVGRPYFVMELVRGEAITEFCDRRRMGTTARLGLFLEVCEAIQHAHQRGVIHRDIKPSNVLVAEADGRIELKVIDFGIASVLEDPKRAGGAGQTRATAVGQFIGTPEYMSPEQADPAGGIVDTRSDVYSLGVLLYQLVTGQVPYTRSEVIVATMAGADGARGAAVDVEARRPSSRLGSMGKGLTSTAEARGTDGKTLVKQVRGDLDWIALKALCRDPAGRYASVSEMAEDVRRSMADLPILAHAPSMREQVGKFVRRHRVGVIGAVAVAAALIAGMVGTGVGLVRARESARKEKDAGVLAENRRVAAEAAQVLAERRREEAEYEAYTGRIAAAAGALEASGPVNLKAWLDECPARLRGWEWRYLHGLADQSAGVVLRTVGGVQSLACSPDGSLVAAACRDAGAVVVVKMGEAGAAAEVARLEMVSPEDVRFSPDGRWLACGCRERGRTLRVFEVDGWKESVRSWGLGTVWDVEYSPDSRLLAVLVEPGEGEGRATVRVLDAATGEERVDTKMPGYFSVAWSADGRWVATGDAKGYLRAWDVRKGERVLERRLTKNKVTGVVFGKGGMLAACDDDGGVTVLREGNEAEWVVDCVLDQGRGPGFRAAFSADGLRLAVGSWASTTWVWDLGTRTLEREVRGHESIVHGVAWAGGTRLCTGSYDGTVRVWRMDRPPQTVRVGEESVDPWMSVSPDGTLVAMWTKPGRLGVMRLRDGREEAAVEVRGGIAYGFKFMHDGRRVLVSDRNGELAVVDPWTGERRVVARAPGAMRLSAMSPSGRYVAGHAAGHGCVVVDLERGEVVWGMPEARTWEAIAMEGERTVLAHSRDNVVERWDLDRNEVTMRAEEGNTKTGKVYAGSVSADGRYIATAAFSGEITILDAQSGAVAGGPAKIDQFPGMVRFTSDGGRLISTGGDGLVRFWEVPSMRPMAAIRAGRSGIHGEMTPDGGTLVVKWIGGVVRIWRTGEEK